MLQQYYHINEAAGISIGIGKDGVYTVSACSVTVEKKQLQIKAKLPALNKISDVAKQMPARSLGALNLYGRGVLQKQIEKTEEINQNNFSQILPNGNIADFYVQNFISGNYSFVSVIRRAEADKWIALVNEAGFSVVMLSLGPFPVKHVLPQLNVYGNEIKFDGNVINRNEQSEWVSTKYEEGAVSDFPVKIESESIDEKLIIAYVNAFQLVLSSKIDVIQADVPDLSVVLQKVTEEKKLKVYGALVLGVFFVLLLVNFFIFSTLNSSNGKLTELVSRSAQNSDDLQQTNLMVHQKDSLTKVLGWEGGINKAALIDQVASMLPPEITWKEAWVDPVDQAASRNQKTILFSTRKIRITGNSERIIPVNEWIARIKTKNWVKNVQLDSYAFSSEQNTGIFTIVIDY
ncbi:hypothetical protein [Mucilaginibacter flavidus]|uniref:hypothetical protein n=1 Tax=Mucilaginibacter flavidus TaxID=2949309 RepID=UPI0020939F14|nr:hypothetical protein [Mucilaginibacter flavidus]MCO5949830.1 hypothetical protein [Mucilaginibacter flavidus]